MEIFSLITIGPCLVSFKINSQILLTNSYTMLLCSHNNNYHTSCASGKNGTEKVSFGQAAERPQSAAGLRRRDLTDSELDRPPFVIEPAAGHVLVGNRQEFHVTFSPLDCVTGEAWIDCRCVVYSFHKTIGILWNS